MTEQSLSYRPVAVSPPGDTLAELLEERGIAQAELARRMGRPINAINEMVLGAKEITEDLSACWARQRTSGWRVNPGIANALRASAMQAALKAVLTG